MGKVYLYHLVNRNPHPVTCPNCGRKKKFSLYVSYETGEPVDISCGRCSVCGYNYPPRQFFADHGETSQHKATTNLPTAKTANNGREWVEGHNDISEQIVSSYHRHDGTLYNWLCNVFGKERTDNAWNRYDMGVTSDGRAAIYWQRDQLGSYRTGEVITYMSNGHRDHNVDEYWAHNRFANYELKQCLFGLQYVRPDRSALLVVEAPKTALIGSICYPHYTWLAVGSRDQLKPDKLSAIRHHRIIALPDADALQLWTTTAAQLCKDGRYNIEVYDFMDIFHATDNERRAIGSKGDIADLLAMRAEPPYVLPDCQELRAMIERHPSIATLCQEMSLEVVKVVKY